MAPNISERPWIGSGLSAVKAVRFLPSVSLTCPRLLTESWRSQSLAGVSGWRSLTARLPALLAWQTLYCLQSTPYYYLHCWLTLVSPELVKKAKTFCGIL